MEPHMEQTFIAPVPEREETRTRINVVLQLNGMALPVAGVYPCTSGLTPERNLRVEKLVRLRVLDAATTSPRLREAMAMQTSYGGDTLTIQGGAPQSAGRAIMHYGRQHFMPHLREPRRQCASLLPTLGRADG